MTIGKRIGLGFTITLSLTLITGAAGYWGLTRFSSAHQLYQEANQMQLQFKSTKEDLTKYVLYSYTEGRNDQDAALRHLNKTLIHIKSDLDSLATLLPMIKNGTDKLNAVAAGLKAYEAAITLFTETENKKIELSRSLSDIFSKLNEFIGKGQIRTDEMEFLNQQIEAVRIGYVSRHTDQRWKKMKADVDALAAEIKKWLDFIQSSEQLKPVAVGVRSNFDAYSKQIVEYHQLVMYQNTVWAQISLELNKLNASIHALSERSRHHNAAGKTHIVGHYNLGRCLLVYHWGHLCDPFLEENP